MSQTSIDDFHPFSVNASSGPLMYEEMHDEAKDPKDPWIQWLMRLDGVK